MNFKDLLLITVIVAFFYLAISTAYPSSWDNSFDHSITDAISLESSEARSKVATATDVGMYISNVSPWLMALSFRKNRAKNLIAIGVGQGSTILLTQATKFIAGRDRPNLSNNKSFFSGHTSSSFASSALICSQTRRMKSHKKLCLSSLLISTSVGIGRVVARRHWASDVLVGMGVGYFSSTYFPKLVIRY